MSEPVVRDDFTRGEAAWGIVWLCIGAAVSALLETVYLGASVFGVPFPASVAVALFFNAVLTRTALLWTSIRAAALAPLGVWLAAAVSSAVWLGSNNILALALIFAGLAGGVWPLVRGE